MSTTLETAATLPALCRTLGVTIRQIEYAVASRGITPDRRIGGWRLYGHASQARIVAALRETGALPATPETVEATR